MIFDFPKERSKSLDRRFILDPVHLSHGHLTREHTHYRYYVHIEDFFRRNEPGIKKWLESVRTTSEFRGICSEIDRIVILAPGHFSNAGFVNTVNEVLFSNSATVIHYDAREDEIQNFRRFYENEIADPNVKIFFVDDTITTGTMFIRTNYFIKFSRKAIKEDELRGLDGFIVMLDRSNEFVFENVKRKLEHRGDSFFAFANLHIPLLRPIGRRCPLCLEGDRYENLAETCYLDRIKAHFLKQRIKLSKSETRDSHRDLFSSPELATNSKNHKAEKVKKKVEAMYRISEWFSNPKNRFSDVESFDTWIKDLFKIALPFISILHLTEAHNSFTETKAIVIKVLVCPEIMIFEPLRTKVFKWVLEMLSDCVKLITEEINAGSFSMNRLRELKFLIRRAALLKSNYLISEEFFTLLQIY